MQLGSENLEERIKVGEHSGGGGDKSRSEARDHSESGGEDGGARKLFGCHQVVGEQIYDKLEGGRKEDYLDHGIATGQRRLTNGGGTGWREGDSASKSIRQGVVRFHRFFG